MDETVRQPEADRVAFDAFLLVSFGGPEGPDDVLPFLENVARGRKIPPERLQEVARHYERFDGHSPINSQNRALLAALVGELNAHGPQLPIYWGNRNWHPMLADAVRQMADDGVQNALAFVTSAFGSYSGCRQYTEDIERARQEVGPDAPRIEKLRLFYNHPGFIESMADRVAAAFREIPEERRAAARLVFTAHSLPVSAAQASPYEHQLREACRLVAGLLVPACGMGEGRDGLPSPACGGGAGGEGGLQHSSPITRAADSEPCPASALTLTLSQRERGQDDLPSPFGRGAGGEGGVQQSSPAIRESDSASVPASALTLSQGERGPNVWSLAFQSRSGPPSQPWLAPDIGDHLRQLHADGVRDVVVAPIGFLAENLEIIYDLDIEAHAVCDELGIQMVRAAVVGSHPRFVQMIGDLVRERFDPTASRLALGADGPWPDVCAAGCCK